MEYSPYFNERKNSRKYGKFMDFLWSVSQGTQIFRVRQPRALIKLLGPVDPNSKNPGFWTTKHSLSDVKEYLPHM